MKNTLTTLLLFLLISNMAQAHQASVSYVANEAVLVTHGDKKVLFDPFFHQAFGTYQLVPEQTKQAIFAGQAPYDNITAIVISHAHGDHFSADEVLQYLKKYPSTQLVAPQQAIKELNKLSDSEQINKQIHSIALKFKQRPISLEVAGVNFEVVRIPHAGWPSRAEVENLVFRITLHGQPSPVTVMHLGDADPDIEHYLPYKAHWQKRVTHTAFPPYWFYFSAEGNDILDTLLNIQQSIGIHVPVNVPAQLKATGKDYFSIPGDSRKIAHLN